MQWCRSWCCYWYCSFDHSSTLSVTATVSFFSHFITSTKTSTVLFCRRQPNHVPRGVPRHVARPRSRRHHLSALNHCSNRRRWGRRPGATAVWGCWAAGLAADQRQGIQQRAACQWAGASFAMHYVAGCDGNYLVGGSLGAVKAPAEIRLIQADLRRLTVRNTRVSPPSIRRRASALSLWRHLSTGHERM